MVTNRKQHVCRGERWPVWNSPTRGGALPPEAVVW